MDTTVTNIHLDLFKRDCKNCWNNKSFLWKL